MVVSDHGFEAGRSMGLLTGAHKSEQALLGVIFASGPGGMRLGLEGLRYTYG